mmetsp:Transcript_19444/g.37241  ORF Transcript_19444/g.37241 Transcript_19444/m.37241 type:complete len:346 (+) Transcript_19444:783-1820(+)
MIRRIKGTGLGKVGYDHVELNVQRGRRHELEEGGHPRHLHVLEVNGGRGGHRRRGHHSVILHRQVLSLVSGHRVHNRRVPELPVAHKAHGRVQRHAHRRSDLHLRAGDIPNAHLVHQSFVRHTLCGRRHRDRVGGGLNASKGGAGERHAHGDAVHHQGGRAGDAVIRPRDVVPEAIIQVAGEVLAGHLRQAIARVALGIHCDARAVHGERQTPRRLPVQCKGGVFLQQHRVLGSVVGLVAVDHQLHCQVAKRQPSCRRQHVRRRAQAERVPRHRRYLPQTRQGQHVPRGSSEWAVLHLHRHRLGRRRPVPVGHSHHECRGVRGELVGGKAHCRRRQPSLVREHHM